MLDGADLPANVKTMFMNIMSNAVNGTVPNTNKPVSDHPEDNKAKRNAEIKEKMNINQ